MRKFFATLFAVGFVLLAPVVIPATIIQVRVFTPDSLKQLVRAAQLGERLPQLAATLLVSQASQEGQSVEDTFQQFGGEDLFERAITTVFPPSDVYTILDGVIDVGFVWWHSGEPIKELDLAIDLSSAKQRLGPIVLEAVKTQIEQLPVCTEEDLSAFETQGNEDLFSLSCKPEGFSLDSLEKAGLSTEMLTQAVLVSVPDQFDVNEFFDQMAESDPEQLVRVNQSLDSARQTASLAALVLRILQVAVLVCFLMVGLLRLLPGRVFFTWMAWILFIPGFELAAGAAGLVFVPRLVEQQVLVSNPELVQAIPITPVVQAFIRTFSMTTLWIGLGMLGFGITLFVLSRFLKHPNHSTAVTESNKKPSQ